MENLELRKAIGESLQARRKAAGYRSARSFADAAGIPLSAYTEYEQGRRAMSYERAWEIADVLGCSMDELGGREFKVGESVTMAADAEHRELVECFESSDGEGRRTLIGVARAVRDASRRPRKSEE